MGTEQFNNGERRRVTKQGFECISLSRFTPANIQKYTSILPLPPSSNNKWKGVEKKESMLHPQETYKTKRALVNHNTLLLFFLLSR